MRGQRHTLGYLLALPLRHHPHIDRQCGSKRGTGAPGSTGDGRLFMARSGAASGHKEITDLVWAQRGSRQLD